MFEVTSAKITAADAPELMRVVHEIAAKTGVAAPELWIMHHPWFEQVPLAAAMGKNKLVFNHNIFDAMGTTMDGHVPPELEAVVGHEFSHIKHFNRDVGLTRLTPILACAAAVLGYRWYEKSKHLPAGSAEFHENIDGLHQEAVSYVSDASPSADTKEAPHLPPAQSKGFLRTAKYAAVALAGLGVGLLAARQFSIAVEYAADKHGATMTSPEAMRNALQKVVEWMERNPASSGPQIPALLRETILAHPTVPQRVAAL